MNNSKLANEENIVPNHMSSNSGGLFTRSHLLIAFAGGIGGASSTLINLAKDLIANQSFSPPGIGFFIGAAIFFFLGALVAFFFNERNLAKALMLGISIPALLVVGQSKAEEQPYQIYQPERVTIFDDSIPSAEAQSQDVQLTTQANSEKPPTANTTEIWELQLYKKPSVECFKCTLRFYANDEKLLSEEHFIEDSNIQSFDIPNGATRFGIIGNKFNAETWSLPSEIGQNIEYDFDYEYNFWKDLRRGLGSNKFKSFDPTISPHDSSIRY